MKRTLDLSEREELALREFFMELGAHGYLRTNSWLLDVFRPGTAAALRRIARKVVTGSRAATAEGEEDGPDSD